MIRPATLSDLNLIAKLYQAVAAIPGGIARQADEISWEYVENNLSKSLQSGICLVAEENDQIVAEIHSYKLVPKVFDHVLSELTIVAHPDWQGKGIGKEIFTAFLQEVKSNRPEILRVELIARESNIKAINFYQKIGFRIEGKLENRIANPDGTFESDIPMGWVRDRI